ncbi:kinase-like domain-containing protein [Xylaria sp. FL1777]|nr:kinase-like domain-containing protein [Xylaria sp. FL1777]
MDWDERGILDNNVSFLLWIRKYDKAREEQLTDWVSTLHSNRLPCELATHKLDDSRGAYNINCKVVFTNGEKWMVRFPMVGKVMNADEKVEIEVAAMKLIRQQTNIPIPDVKAWGLAADNPLGIGPFIVTEFIEGVSVDNILQNTDARMMKEDVSEDVVETIFRQTINFQLQLQQLKFPRIGSLTSTSTTDEPGFSAAIHSRPLTQKAHDFMKFGGVDVLGPRDKTYLSTTEYFHHIVDQDLRHLHRQLNSVDDADDARDKFVYWKVMKALIARHVLPGRDKGPFKFMCDDFQPANMIVNNEEELKIVAVIDWEWSYAAPAQLVHSTPSWLLIESPNTWPAVDERLARFNRYLELYTRILEEEEQKSLGYNVCEDERPSSLLRECQKHGRQWFHFILRRGFNGPTCVPFVKLREETEDWDELVSAVPEEEIEAFVQKKVADLQTYETQLAKTQERYEAVLGAESEDKLTFLEENVKSIGIDKERHHWLSWKCFDQ